MPKLLQRTLALSKPVAIIALSLRLNLKGHPDSWLHNFNKSSMILVTLFSQPILIKHMTLKIVIVVGPENVHLLFKTAEKLKMRTILNFEHLLLLL